MASDGATSTMLAVSRDQPFGRYFHASPAYRRALELHQVSNAIEIVSEDDIRERLIAMQACAAT